MQYFYHPGSSRPILELSGDGHRYLFKVRRHRAGEEIFLRNLNDDILYTYLIESMDKRTATLRLQTQRTLRVTATKSLHIGWCLIDPKSIEKMLPSLNEMGVEKITFISCDRSQKQFKPDLSRLEKILVNSSQQSGRSTLIAFDFIENLKVFLVKYPEATLLHFSEKNLERSKRIETIVVGCEGGLSSEELGLFEKEKIIGLDTPMILRSESAVAAIASKLLL